MAVENSTTAMCAFNWKFLGVEKNVGEIVSREFLDAFARLSFVREVYEIGVRSTVFRLEFDRDLDPERLKLQNCARAKTDHSF